MVAKRFTLTCENQQNYHSLRPVIQVLQGHLEELTGLAILHLEPDSVFSDLVVYKVQFDQLFYDLERTRQKFPVLIGLYPNGEVTLLGNNKNYRIDPVSLDLSLFFIQMAEEAFSGRGELL